MPTFMVTGPDGKKYKVTAPEGATEDQIRSMVSQQAERDFENLSREDAEKALAAGQRRLQQHLKGKSPEQRERITAAYNANPEVQRIREAAQDDSFLGGVMAGISKPIDNMATWASNLPVIGPAVDNLGQMMGLPSTREAYEANEQMRESKTNTAGKITGGVIGTLPVAMLPGGPIAQGAAAGLMLSEDPEDPQGLMRDATIGGVAGKAGDVVGRKVIGPAASRVMSSKPARTLKQLITGSSDDFAGLGDDAVRVANQLRTPEAVAAARQNIDDAAQYGLPYSLADSSPELRALAGHATRKAPQAFAQAERTLAPRAAGQVDRAASAIDDYLAPVLPRGIQARSETIGKAAQRASRPLYDQAMRQAAPDDEALNALLNTPAGMKAMKEAVDIGMNAGDDVGQIVGALESGGFQASPDYKTLQLVKRGLDSVLYRPNNMVPGTTRLNMSNPTVQSVNSLRSSLAKRLGELNPAYREADRTFSEVIRLRDALEQGTKALAPNTKPAVLRDLVKGMSPAQQRELSRGMATQMSDDISNVRVAGNPYERVFGSPAQREKIATVFGGGADDFGRIYQLERDMADTAGEVLGGSATARRLQADDAFGNQMGEALNAGAELMTTGATPGFFARQGTKLADIGRFGVGASGQRRAENVADLLLRQANPETLGALLKEQLEALARQDAIGRIGGRTAAAGGIAALSE